MTHTRKRFEIYVGNRLERGYMRKHEALMNARLIYSKGRRPVLVLDTKKGEIVYSEA